MSNEALPEFDRPPVVEVVCGVQFKELPGLYGAYLGSLWSRFKADFPICREVPPLPPVVENFDGRGGIQVEFVDVPPMPRTWFVRDDETELIQVQRDRLLHNWKKVKDADAYPRYVSVIGQFRTTYDHFCAFIEEFGLGNLDPFQYELTYVNHVPAGTGWNSLGEVGNVLRDFRRDETESRFLPPPEGIHWRTTFALPNHAGRLHITVRQVRRPPDGVHLLQFELTARGFPAGAAPAAMMEWFDLAHAWIVRGFADFTTSSARESLWAQTR